MYIYTEQLISTCSRNKNTVTIMMISTDLYD